MPTIGYAATRFGYCVQVLDNGQVVYEYTAGNHQKESSTVIDPHSPNAVKLRQLKAWAKQTAREIGKERGIPTSQIKYDPDLENQLKENDQQR